MKKAKPRITQDKFNVWEFENYQAYRDWINYKERGMSGAILKMIKNGRMYKI